MLHPSSTGFYERLYIKRRQVLLENTPSTRLVKDHLLESGKRYLRMSIDVIKDKDEGEIDFRGQNDEEMRCIDIIVKQTVE